MKPYWFFALLLAAVPGSDAAVPAADAERIASAVPTEPVVRPAASRRLLVFTLAQGYVHDATPWGAEALRVLGERTGAYTALATEDPAVFARDSLFSFDAVCFLNTCFDPFTNVVYQQNLADFVRSGRGYVGIHCSAHTFLKWGEFAQLQGAYSVDHPWHEEVTVTIEEPDHPLMRMFGGTSFRITDEIYQFDHHYSRDRLRVLARLDTDRTDMTRPGVSRADGDFGLVWIQPFGDGRAFYSAFGHDKEVFWNPTILRHYLAGIQYAFGDLPADSTPSARLPGHVPPKPLAALLAPQRRAKGEPTPNGLAFPPLTFDGTRAQAVSVGDLATRGEATVMFWLKTPDPDHDRRLLSQLKGEGGQLGALRLEAGQLELWTAANWQPVLRRSLGSNQWTHVALVFRKDGQVTTYARGREQRTLRGEFHFSGVEAGLGAPFLGTWGQPFIGEIHGLRLERAALAPDQIAQWCNDSRPPVADLASEDASDVWAEAARYEFTGSRFALAEIETLVRQALPSDERRREAETRLVRLLEAPNATPAARQFACAQLRLVGSAAAVPALAAQLKDEQTSQAARLALQSLPDPAAGQALCAALRTASGNQRVGVLTALAVRRDPATLPALKEYLSSDDPAVATAAIAALGAVGGTQAATALSALLGQPQTARLEPELTDALLKVAAGLVDAGLAPPALVLYERILAQPNATVPARAGAAAGLLRAQPPAATATLLRFLEGDDQALRAVALRHLHGLPPSVVVQTFAPRLGEMPEDVVEPITLALADRGGSEATEALAHAATSATPAVRLAALRALGRVEGNADVATVLLDVAASTAGAEQAAARDALDHARGPAFESALVAGLRDGPAPRRVEAARSVGQRGLEAATPALLEAARDADPSVRSAALAALSETAGPDAYPAVVGLLAQATSDADRTTLERALVTVARRIDAEETRTAPLVAALAQAAPPAAASLLSVLSALGGTAALEAVRAAAARPEPSVRGAALRALANWPDAAAAEDLLGAAKSASQATERTLALRGYLRLLGLPGTRPVDQTVNGYRQALELATDLAEKRLVLAGLGELAHPDALRLAEQCATDPALEAEAKLAADKIRKALREQK